MKRLFSLACAVAVLAACGSTAAPSDACTRYFDALVQTSTRCEPSGGTSAGGWQAMDKNAFIAVCLATRTAPGSGLSDSYLDTCSGALASATSCIIRQVPGCQNPPGKLADGAACYASIQCQSGACAKSGSPLTDGGVDVAWADAASPRCGTCDPRAAVDAACDSAGVTAPKCMLGLDCDAGTCKEPVTIPLGGVCSFPFECASGTTCIPNVSGKGTCIPAPKRGENCSGICDTNLVCGAGTCRDKVAVGGACPAGDECQSTLYCDPTTKLCAALKVGKVGDACSPSVGVKCGGDLFCGSVGAAAPTCVALKKKGEACGDGEWCAPFLDCISGTCQTPDPSQCK